MIARANGQALVARLWTPCEPLPETLPRLIQETTLVVGLDALKPFPHDLAAGQPHRPSFVLLDAWKPFPETELCDADGTAVGLLNALESLAGDLAE